MEGTLGEDGAVKPALRLLTVFALLATATGCGGTSSDSVATGVETTAFTLTTTTTTA